MKIKSVSVILTFSATVPEDMDIDEIEKAVEDKLDYEFNEFRIHVKNYPIEEQSEPLFDRDDIFVSENGYQITI